MKIKVWGANPICESFEEQKYYNRNPQEVKVKGLKSHAEYIKEAREKVAKMIKDPVAKECVKQTGLTPEQYQRTYNQAWNA